MRKYFSVLNVFLLALIICVAWLGFNYKKIFRPQHHKFTIVEGWTSAQLIANLNKNAFLIHTITPENSPMLMRELGLPLSNPEGWFYPATYPITKQTTDKSLLKKAYRLMSSTLAQEWQQRAAGLPYKNSYQALIAASLIEKETAQASERPAVAGVIVRRLQINMPLQIDSTIIYGLGSAYTGKLTRVELQKNTPYNTYLHRGLPPTPIAIPSRQSIHAALHPLINNNLYFVAKGNGTHEFSANLASQNKAVNTYQLQITFPVVGKKLNTKSCINYWYLSPKLQQLFSDHC